MVIRTRQEFQICLCIPGSLAQLIWGCLAKKSTHLSQNRPSAATFSFIYYKSLLWDNIFLKNCHFAMKLFIYIGTFLQVNAPIYLDVFMFYKLVSTYLYIAMRQALMPLLWPSGQSGSELLVYKNKPLQPVAGLIFLPIVA